MKSVRPGTEEAFRRYINEFAREVNTNSDDHVVMNYKRFRYDPFLMHESIHYAISHGKAVHVVWRD